MSNEVTPAVQDFARTVAPKVFTDGQGYDVRRLDSGATVEAAWYRENGTSWTLALAVEKNDKRVETPPSMRFEYVVEPVEAEQRERELVKLVGDELQKMLATV